MGQLLDGGSMPPAWLDKFEFIEQDAHDFLETFCRRFPPGVVSLSSRSWGFELTPTRSGAVPVPITVRNGEPIVVAGINETIFEWMADLETYSSSWWNAKLEPLLAAVAAGKVTEILWIVGGRVAAVDTHLEIDGRVERFRSYLGFRGVMA